jgi:CheY-like chemotaxis protein
MLGGDLPARPIEILLVEDSESDVYLTRASLEGKRTRNSLHVARDGEEAMAFLRHEGVHAEAPRPDVILLDLNLPKKDGREVLAEVKADPDLGVIPVVVITTSQAEEDVLRSYELRANCYVTKPIDLTQFQKVVKAVEGFWFSIVTLPPGVSNGRGSDPRPPR